MLCFKWICVQNSHYVMQLISKTYNLKSFHLFNNWFQKQCMFSFGVVFRPKKRALRIISFWLFRLILIKFTLLGTSILNFEYETKEFGVFFLSFY